MQFYLLMAILTPVLFRIRSQLVAIAVFVLVSIAIAGAWRYFGNSIIAKDGNEFRNYRVFVVTTQLPGHLDEFALGICVAFFVRSRIFERVCGNVVWCILLAAAFAPLFYLSIILYGGVISAEFSITVRGAVYAVTFALAVLIACSISSPRLIKATKWPAYLGVVSYGIYLWHLPVILTLKKFGLSPPLMLASTLASSVSLAALSWHFLEAPLLKIGRSERQIVPSVAGQTAASA